MGNLFASRTIMLFMHVPYPRCAHSCFSSNISSRFDHRQWHHNVSTNTTTCSTSSYSHFFCMSSVILMLRTYAFSGRKKTVLAALSITFLTLVGVIIWVISKHLARLSQRPFTLWGVFLTPRWNRSAPLIHDRTHWLFRHFGPTDFRFSTGGQWWTGGRCGTGSPCLSHGSAYRTLACLSDFPDKILYIGLDNLCTIFLVFTTSAA